MRDNRAMNPEASFCNAVRTLLIVEDHVLVREALAQTLRHADGGWRVLEAARAEEALAMLEAEPECELVIVDLMLPDLSGLSLLGVIGRRFPGVPALVVSALDDEASMRRALRQGASGFVSKNSSSAELLRAVAAVLDGELYAPAAAAMTPPVAAVRRIESLAERYGLTAAQGRVFELLAQGCSNREIAERLGIAEGTVKLHVTAIFRAMGVPSRAQALVELARLGFRPLPARC